MRNEKATCDSFNERQLGTLPDLLGIRTKEVNDGAMLLEMEIEPHHLAPNGYLHAGAVVTLADTAAGYGTVAHLPEGASGFTTIELKSNFLATALKGVLQARATLVHSGRTTQVWDATVATSEGKVLAMFRCTQIVLWPKDK